MKTTFRKFAVVLATALIGTFRTATANAGCGNLQQIKPGASLHRQSWQGQGDFASGSLQLIADYGDDPIVGLWRVTLTAKGNVGLGLPPDGTVIDNAFCPVAQRRHGDHEFVTQPRYAKLLPGSVEEAVS